MPEEIVISGISGRFPESDNLAEFSENLFGKVDLCSEIRRWDPIHVDLPEKMGQLKDISKFDNAFFGVNKKQAHSFDPQMRILLEVTHEAIIDAGCDPAELQGKKVGVYIGNVSTESDEFINKNPKKEAEFAVCDGMRTMLPNRISFMYDLKGPSFSVDTACSSGAVALYHAVQALRSGEIESALVGGSNVIQNLFISLKMRRLQASNKDGVCKTFDAEGDGYGRSEGVVVLYIQRVSDARRKYASIVHIKTNTDGYKLEGEFHPSSTMQRQLMEEVYEECMLSPLKVCYVEAHGTGTPAGDPVEVNAIEEVFCPGREKPLLIGSVKSNMGHSEASAGHSELYVHNPTN